MLGPMQEYKKQLQRGVTSPAAGQAVRLADARQKEQKWEARAQAYKQGLDPAASKCDNSGCWVIDTSDATTQARAALSLSLPQCAQRIMATLACFDTLSRTMRSVLTLSLAQCAERIVAALTCFVLTRSMSSAADAARGCPRPRTGDASEVPRRRGLARQATHRTGPPQRPLATPRRSRAPRLACDGSMPVLRDCCTGKRDRSNETG